MKKSILALLVAAFALVITSCDKNGDVKAPEAYETEIFSAASPAVFNFITRLIIDEQYYSGKDIYQIDLSKYPESGLKGTLNINIENPDSRFDEATVWSTQLKGITYNGYKIEGEIEIENQGRGVLYGSVKNGVIETKNGNILYSDESTVELNKFNYDLEYRRKADDEEAGTWLRGLNAQIQTVGSINPMSYELSHLSGSFAPFAYLPKLISAGTITFAEPLALTYKDIPFEAKEVSLEENLDKEAHKYYTELYYTGKLAGTDGDRILVARCETDKLLSGKATKDDFTGAIVMLFMMGIL